MNTWHKCKGCGGLIGLMRDGLIIDGVMMEPPGSVMHTKPAEHVNRIPAQCPLYQQLSVEELTELHKDLPIEIIPEDIRPAYHDN